MNGSDGQDHRDFSQTARSLEVPALYNRHNLHVYPVPTMLADHHGPRRVLAYVLIVLSAVGLALTRSHHASPVLAAGLQTPNGTRLVLLGTGTPGAEPDRSGPASAVVVGDRAYLVDLGPGVVRQASKASLTRGVSPLYVPNLDIAFLTHLHSDHTAGYADLILTPWVLGRRQRLRVYGPPGLEAMTDALLEAYREDIRVRITGPEELPRESGGADAYEISEGLVYRDDLVEVEAFAVPHGIWEHAFGYKFTTADRVVVISGDTGPFEGLVDIARDADVLVHEAYAARGFQRRSAQTQRYHGTFHTSATKVGQIAKAANVGMVVLYHQLHLAGGTPEEMVAEVKAEYDGPVHYGRDLDVY